MFVIKLALLKLTILIGKILGKGSSFPGMLANKIKFNFNDINITDKKIIYVIGTNGKTTTTNFIFQLLKNNNINVITNHEGANLETGIKTLILKHTKFNHQLDCDTILLEVDEKTIKHITNILPPQYVVVTNFFRDQLDRYGEIDLIVEEIKQQLINYQPQMFLNGNDPYIYYQFNDFTNKHYYGLTIDNINNIATSRKVENYQKVRDMVYCPICKQPLTYDYFHYGHLGSFSCQHCNINPKIEYQLVETTNGFIIDNQSYQIDNLPLYFLFNVISSVSIIKYLGLSIESLEQLIKEFKFPPGRNQTTTYNNTPMYINLVKNVVGFEETIDYVINNFDQYQLIICLNDNYADGKDISWIYDVNVDQLLKQATTITTSGLRAYDMALRLELSTNQPIDVIEDINRCLTTTINGPQQVVVISNYTALPQVLNTINK